MMYVLLYVVTLLNQFAHKKYYQGQYRRRGRTLDRYRSPEMHHPDRLVGNFVEWTPVFLCPVWCMAATKTLSTSSVTAAHVYLCLRALYIVLSVRYGVSPEGNNVPLWISTFPAYGCLFYLYRDAIRNVLL
jgi:uncharacterized MAPEG superfamily protein